MQANGLSCAPQDQLEAVVKILPRITETFKGDGDAAAGIRRVSSVVLDVVRENTPEDQQKQVEEAAQFTNGILDSFGALIKDLPKFDVPEFKVPNIEIPEIVIPKIEIPDIPEVVIPEFKVPDFQS